MGRLYEVRLVAMRESETAASPAHTARPAATTAFSRRESGDLEFCTDFVLVRSGCFDVLMGGLLGWLFSYFRSDADAPLRTNVSIHTIVASVVNQDHRLMVRGGTFHHHRVTALHGSGRIAAGIDPFTIQETQMKSSTVLLAAIPVIALGAAALPLLAEDAPKPRTFVQMAEAMPDGKVTKSAVMGAVERTFDKADIKKEGKLDSNQAKQFQFFLKEFTRESGA
jgi:hypothetical protein